MWCVFSFGLTIFQVQLSMCGQQLLYQMAQVNIFVKAGPKQPQLCVQFSPTLEVWLFQGWFNEITSLIDQAFNSLPALFSLAYSLQQLFFSSVVYFTQLLESHLYISTQYLDKDSRESLYSFPELFLCIAPHFLALCSVKPSSLYLLNTSLSP